MIRLHNTILLNSIRYLLAINLLPKQKIELYGIRVQVAGPAFLAEPTCQLQDYLQCLRIFSKNHFLIPVHGIFRKEYIKSNYPGGRQASTQTSCFCCNTDQSTLLDDGKRSLTFKANGIDCKSSAQTLSLRVGEGN